MALIPANNYAGQITTGDPGWPHGKAKNVTVSGDGTGTPLEAAWLNDAWGFFQAMLAAAGITPSGNPDSATASQYLDALKNLFHFGAPHITYAGFWELGSSPVVTWQSGDTVTFQDGGTSMYCDFATGVADIAANAVLITSNSDSYNYFLHAGWNTTTRLIVGARALTDGSSLDVTTNANLPRLRIIICQ